MFKDEFKHILSALVIALAFTCGRALGEPAIGECPQPRFTDRAPPDYLAKTDPLPSTAEKIRAGEFIYLGNTDSASCMLCHGKRGDGKGVLAGQFEPRPRNFTCAQTINGVADGQLFWIIRFGSPGTAMPPHAKLSDEQTWQVIQYLRRLAR